MYRKRRDYDVWLNELSVPLIDSQTIPDETIQYYLKVADEKGFEVFFLI